MEFTSIGYTSIKLKKISIIDCTHLCIKREVQICTKAKFRSNTSFYLNITVSPEKKKSALFVFSCHKVIVMI
jgi:hypothetical protein